LELTAPPSALVCNFLLLTLLAVCARFRRSSVRSSRAAGSSGFFYALRFSDPVPFRREIFFTLLVSSGAQSFSCLWRTLDGFFPPVRSPVCPTWWWPARPSPSVPLWVVAVPCRSAILPRAMDFLLPLRHPLRPPFLAGGINGGSPRSLPTGPEFFPPSILYVAFASERRPLCRIPVW